MLHPPLNLYLISTSSVPDYEDVYEFADEYVTNIISSVMTEVSMTTDSGVEELCEDDIVSLFT